ncbi:MAG: DUF58 domain-containing protein [Chitinophagales bacterium]|nr:DUF58 domain-containing protein [Chitinophagales bacterium]
MKFFKQLYLNHLFFGFILLIIIGFAISFIFHGLYMIIWYLFATLMIFVVTDILLLFGKRNGLIGHRTCPEKFSNGDQNEILVTLENNYTFSIATNTIDEIPFQFQMRNFSIKEKIKAKKTIDFTYKLRPTERGEYVFGNLNVYVSSPLGLASRRFTFAAGEMIPTYPSFLQLKKYDLLAFSNNLHQYGTKKVRRVGYSMEFEQIKEYVQGDDIRTLNWKATAKKNALMVNQYQTERSQTIYMVIDKGRVMKMPFNGLSLLDYAINATLVLSNIVLKKDDRAGMFSFAKKVENRVVAEKRGSQMNKLLEALYNVETNFQESDFGRLYIDIKKHIQHRSLIMLYTNFETMDGLYRQLPYLKGIAKNHLLVVVFFQNTELHDLVNQRAKNVQEVYDKAIAEKFIFEKKLIVNELRKYGIYSLLTRPEDLTVDSINKYLEIKTRGLI